MPKEGTLDLLVAFGVVSVSTFSTLALFVAKSPVGFVVCGAVAVLCCLVVPQLFDNTLVVIRVRLRQPRLDNAHPDSRSR